MPARQLPSHRRQSRRLKKEKGSSYRVWFLIKIVLLLLLPILLFVFIARSTYFWDAKSKTAVVIARDNGDVDIAVFDPKGGILTIVNIPGSTEVSVAQNLGTWRLKSVGKLGQKEGVGGALLTQTLARHFSFPVFIWAEDEAYGFADGDFKDLLIATIAPYKTNLGIGDRLHLFYFSLSVRNSKKEIIQLAETKYLKKMTLLDGEVGYQVTGAPPPALAAIFSEPDFTEESARTRVVDRTGNKVGDEIAGVAQVLGLKVVSIDEEVLKEIDCEVVGRDVRAVNLLARIWGCSEEVDKEAPLDLMISIGSDFAERY